MGDGRIHNSQSSESTILTRITSWFKQMKLFVVTRTGGIEQVPQPIGWNVDWFLSLFILTLQYRIDGDGEKRALQLLVRFRILGARKEENIFPRVERLRIRCILVPSLVTQLLGRTSYQTLAFSGFAAAAQVSAPFETAAGKVPPFSVVSVAAADPGCLTALSRFILMTLKTGNATPATTRMMAITTRIASLRPRMDGVWDGEPRIDQFTIHYGCESLRSHRLFRGAGVRSFIRQ
jgi:hypothetical protein